MVDVGADDLRPRGRLPGGTASPPAPGSSPIRAASGVVIGGSGNGEQIAANKVTGVRAALAWSEETARLARAHNDANVVAIGARMHTMDEAVEIVTTFLQTPFSGEERHVRRIGQLAAYEETHEIPASV